MNPKYITQDKPSSCRLLNWRYASRWRWGGDSKLHYQHRVPLLLEAQDFWKMLTRKLVLFICLSFLSLLPILSISRYKLCGYHMTDDVEYSTDTCVVILHKCGLQGWLLGKTRVSISSTSKSLFFNLIIVQKQCSLGCWIVTAYSKLQEAENK